MPISNTMIKPFKLIAITSGDPNGIGFEVAAKALCSKEVIDKSDGYLFFLFRDSHQEVSQKKIFSLIDKKWNRVTFNSIEQALQFALLLKKTDHFAKKILIDLSLSSSAADWIVLASHFCREKIFSALVTGPLSKTLIKKSGYNFVGHTGLFKKMFPRSKLFMGFMGKDFNVLLATDHIPVNQVEKSLTAQTIRSALAASVYFRSILGSNKKIGVLGLNPHAGEKNIIGSFEKNILSHLGPTFHGPLVPDAAFMKKFWSQYSLYLCMYHDQGLIPFKMHHGQDSGVHITIGLPFIRTSVDHGTAFDIFNKNIANPESMKEAILLSLKTAKTQATRGKYV